MAYEHTQRGYIFWFVVVDLIALVVVIFLVEPGAGLVVAVVGLAGAFIVGLVWIFNRLTVTVRDGTVTAAFGRGWPKRQIDLASVLSVRQVRNHWFWGWGLRWVPKGWMYNVWGLDAVELELDTGRVFRIGTDQPEELLAALEAARS